MNAADSNPVTSFNIDSDRYARRYKKWWREKKKFGGKIVKDAAASPCEQEGEHEKKEKEKKKEKGTKTESS